MKNLFLLLVLSCNVQTACAQRPAGVPSYIGFAPPKYIKESDPIFPVLEGYRQKIQERYDDGSNIVVAEFSQWIDVQSTATIKLFPDLRFATITWDEKMHPEAKKKGLDFGGLGGGFQKTLGVETVPNRIKYEMVGWSARGDVSFQSLHAEYEVRIRDIADAKLVWDAYCELTRKSLWNFPAVRHSEGVWHLGNLTNDRTRSFHEVKLDDRQIITSFRRLELKNP